MRVGIQDHFDSAHRLPGIDGAGEVHGHTYKIEVVVQGDHTAGMVVDFRELRDQTREVMKRYDHCVLNDVIEFPSCENVAAAFFRDLKRAQPKLWCVRIWEGTNKWAEVRLGDPGTGD